MMEKRMQSHSVESLTKDTVAHAKEKEKHKEMFPVGTKYMFQMKTWYVIDTKTEQGTEFRRIMSNYGNEEIVTMDTLIKDMEQGEDGGFVFLEATEVERAMMQAAHREAKNGQ